MAGNVAWVALRRVRSSRQIARALTKVENIKGRLNIQLGPNAAYGQSELTKLYEAVIAVNDHIHTSGDSLSEQDSKMISDASDLVAEKMFAQPRRYPRLERMILRWASKSKRHLGDTDSHSNTARIPTAEPAMTSRESA